MHHSNKWRFTIDHSAILMTKLVKRTKIVLIGLISMVSLFSISGTGFSQEVDPALTEVVREMITNSIGLTIAFTSSDAISSGSFVYEEQNEETRFNITRIPFRHIFNPFNNSGHAPFISFSVGYFEDREMVALSQPPDESRFKTLSLSCGGGVKFELVEKYLWLTPEVDLIYGRTWNEHDYNSRLSQIVYKPILEGIAYNWQVDSFSFAPSLQLLFEYPIGQITIGFETKYTYLNTRTIKEDYPEHQAKAESSLWKNLLRVELPLGISMFNIPLSLKADFSRIELGGKVSQPVKESNFYETGAELVLGTARKTTWLSSLSLGASYTFSERITGWSLRFGYKL